EPLLHDDALMMSTLSEPIASEEEIFNPNAVKVVIDETGNALYFSRAPIPFPRGNPVLNAYRKHVGLYVYRRNFLLEFTRWPRAQLEQIESLEQLRVLARGYSIRVVAVEQSSIGIDTPADLSRARRALDETIKVEESH